MVMKLEEHDAEPPADRIHSFVGILIANRTKIRAHGCPTGIVAVVGGCRLWGFGNLEPVDRAGAHDAAV